MKIKKLHTEAADMNLEKELNDLYTEMCRTRHCIEQQIDMLETAMSAFNRGKMHVVEDHVDRVISEFKKRLSHINWVLDPER